MRSNKPWLLALGVAMLIGGGGMKAEAAAVKHFPNHPQAVHVDVHLEDRGFEFRQTQEERESLLELLHMDRMEFMREAKSGKSIAEMAYDKDVSIKRVVRLIEHQIKDHIDKARRERRITADQADRMKDRASERAKDMVFDEERQRDHHPWRND